MDYISSNQNGSKRKYVVPLVVLMVCAVSLAGTAYAYNTNVRDVLGIGSIYDDQFDFDITTPGHICFDVNKNKSTNQVTYTFNAENSEKAVKVVLKNSEGMGSVSVDASINNEFLDCTVTDAGNGVYFVNIIDADTSEGFTTSEKIVNFNVTVTVNGVAKNAFVH